LPKYKYRKDNNHDALVQAFKDEGARVIDLAFVGNGCPDIIVIVNGDAFFCDIKNPNTAYGKKGLNDQQLLFEKRIKEKVRIARTLEDVISLCCDTIGT